jgi:hypothetical protein
MHKEWVRTVAGETVPAGAPRRFSSEYGTDGEYVGSYWEHEQDVTDDTDEPEADGVYKDTEDDFWLKINGKWRQLDDPTYTMEWDRVEEYAPLELLD